MTEDKRLIRATSDVKVPNQNGRLFVGREPVVVSWAPWWQRRLNDGDIELVTFDEAAPKEATATASSKKK